MTLTCKYSLQACMHASCSVPSSAISWQRTPSNERSMQIIYKQSCETGWHENMKACGACGVGCMESLMQVTCNRKHFSVDAHFINMYIYKICIYTNCINTNSHPFPTSKPSSVLRAIVPHCQLAS